MEEIQVSIFCTTYNHEKYVEKALEGFVCQKTDFAFEALIYDDASTDGTREIISRYAKRYPEIIKPIFPPSNQYQNGVHIYREYLISRAKGRYVALCEGDDYWTDENKLQVQYDALEAHPELDICTHRVSVEHEGVLQETAGSLPRSGIVPVEDVIRGGSEFVATASILCRAEWFTVPNPVNEFSEYDYLWQIMGSLKGGMLYLNENMGVYRAFTDHSWTSVRRNDAAKKAEFLEHICEALCRVDAYSHHRYAPAIRDAIRWNRFFIQVFTESGRDLLKKEYRPFRKGERLYWWRQAIRRK